MAKKDDETEWAIARVGISLLLNNKTEEAEALFAEHPHNFHVKAGRCFVSFMNTLMTFECDKIQQTKVLLKDMERECVSDIGWLKSMKNRVFRAEETGKEYVNRLERQIVLADSQVCYAILAFIQLELTGFIRGTLMLRNAWKVYQHTYSQISQLYRRTFGTSPSDPHTRCSTPSSSGSLYSLQSPQSSSSSEWSTSSHSGSAGHSTSITTRSSLRSSLSMLFSLTGITSEQQTAFVEPTEVARLMAAVSLGYGIYQLCISLVPPALHKTIHFLGFGGDREAGLAALMYARLSKDMRAPLATISLLCYHTCIRPTFGLDGSNLSAGVNTAKQLIAESHSEFSNSALFLFFAGRIERLQANVPGALLAYGEAMKAAKHRGMRLLCLHEVVWCHLIRLDYVKTYRLLTHLQQKSRWSNSIYTYLAAICCGAIGQFDLLLGAYKKIFDLMPTITRTKIPLDQFIVRRAPKLVDQDTGQPHTVLYYRLLAYEVLYLLNSMPSCSPEELREILLDCKDYKGKEPMVGLANLVEGAAHSYLGDKELSVKCFRNCLKRRNPSNDTYDQHVSAFALYELGNALCSSNNVEEGRSLLLRAQNQYKDYDYESRLNLLIHMTLKSME